MGGVENCFHERVVVKLGMPMQGKLNERVFYQISY